MSVVYAEKEYCEKLVSDGKAWKVVDEVIERVETFENGSIRAVVEDTVVTIIDNGETYTVLSEGSYLCTVAK